MRADESQPWFQSSGELVERLKASRRAEARVPEVRGYGDLVAFGRGGQGVVFAARRHKDGRRVALKVFAEEAFVSPRSRRRFEREVELVARLRHPNVVRLLQWGSTSDGRSFLAMEFVEGAGLEEYLEENPEEVLEVFVQIAKALDHAHRRGVIHRDLKPANVRVDGGGRVRLLDFGLAKPTLEGAAGSPSSPSRSGEFLGSLAWASPEQLSGQPDDVDTRSDLYTFGILLYRALSGRFPYPVEGALPEVVRNVESAPPRALRRTAPEVSRDLETVVLRCLAKDPERRYAGASELVRDLEHVQEGEPIEARRDGLGHALRALWRRHRAASVAALVGGATVVAAAVVSFLFFLDAREAEGRTLEALEARAAETKRVEAVNEYLLSALVPSLPPEELRAVPLAEVVERAAEKLEDDPALRETPAVAAELHQAFAYWFASFPEGFGEAEYHVDEALRLRRGLDPPDETAVLTSLESLGWLYLQQKRFEPSRKTLTEALELARRVDVDDLRLARLEGLMVNACLGASEREAAEPHVAACHELLRRALGDDDPQTVAMGRTHRDLLRELGRGEEVE